MKDREMVRMAYRLILGREPESDRVLNRKFESIHTLRTEFLNSDEFARQFSKVSLSTGELLGNSKFQIANINEGAISFLWVINSIAHDPISQCARNSQININHVLFDLYETPGTFLDLGGNIGAFSLPFAARGWKGYVFEASSINVRALEKSICLNDFDITVINKAVYDKTGNIYFHQAGPFGMVKNEMQPNKSWEEIPCLCLDDWCTKDGSAKEVDFIKMDIEGAEVAALRGMNEMLKKYAFPPIFVESNSWTLFLQDETQRSLLSTAHKLGYSPYILEADRLLKYDIHNFPAIMYTDFLLLKDIPKNMKIKEIGTYIQDPKEVKAYLMQSLSKVYENDSRQDLSTCYALKDFPDYVANKEIKTKLEQIAEKMAQDEFLTKYLGWFIGTTV